MPFPISPILSLAALDQLIIRREINLTRLEEQLAQYDSRSAGQQAVETAISIATVAMERLQQKRVVIVTGDL